MPEGTDILEKRQRLGELTKQQRDLLERAKKEKRDFTAEEEAEYEKRDKDLDELDKVINAEVEKEQRASRQSARESKVADLTKRLAERTSRGVVLAQPREILCTKRTRKHQPAGRERGADTPEAHALAGHPGARACHPSPSPDRSGACRHAWPPSRSMMFCGGSRHRPSPLPHRRPTRRARPRPDAAARAPPRGRRRFAPARATPARPPPAASRSGRGRGLSARPSSAGRRSARAGNRNGGGVRHVSG